MAICRVLNRDITGTPYKFSTAKEAGIGVVSEPVSGMRLWLRGSTQDQSGNGFHGSISSISGAQGVSIIPSGLDGYPEMQFNDKSEIVFPFFMSGATAATLYMIYNQTNSTNEVFDIARTSGNLHRMRHQYATVAESYWGLFKGTRANNYPLDIPQMGAHLATFHSGSEYYEGTFDGISKGKLPADFSTGDQFVLGRYFDIGSYLGRLSEIIVYNQIFATNSPEHLQNLAYLRTKYPSAQIA